MIKIYDESLVKPLFNIFKFLLETGNFWRNWIGDNKLSVHKKGNKDLINSYRPVFLPAIFSNLYEKCIYEAYFNYLDVNDLFFMSQFGVRKDDSCAFFALFFITHEIFKGFDANPLFNTHGI